MRLTKTLTIQMLLAAVLLFVGGSEARAYSSQPDANGKYDTYYDRPTYFPDWVQPSFANQMSYLCEVHVGKKGPVLQNYEIAVYDQNNELRSCRRSRVEDDHHCVLTIKGDEGDVFHFQVIYGDDFQHPFIADVADVTVPFKTNAVVGTSSEPFLLTIPGRTYLSETDTQAPDDVQDADVTLEITLPQGQWNTICLPFAMTAAQVKAAFGDQVLLGSFEGCDHEFDNDDNALAIVANFSTATAIQANVPYIICPSVDVTAFEADGVDITVSDDPTVKKDKVKKMYNMFVGCYAAGDEELDDCLLLSNGQLSYTGEEAIVALQAYHAYFDFYDYLVDGTDPLKTTFTVEGSSITMRLVRSSDVSISFPAVGEWTAYRADANLLVPQGLEAYAVSGLQADAVVVTPLSAIPAGVPVLLHRTDANQTAFATETVSQAAQPSQNLLQVAATGRQVQAGECYVLYGDEFVLVSDGTLPAGAFFLPADEGAAPVRRIVGTTTGIDIVQPAGLTIQAPVYDLQGRKVSHPAKGLYVKGGRKLLLP